jgi:hypothetical protein
MTAEYRTGVLRGKGGLPVKHRDAKGAPQDDGKNFCGTPNSKAPVPKFRDGEPELQGFAARIWWLKTTRGA